MADKENSYTVGYKKPPAASRFKSGQSGNPKGRPKGAKNFATAFEKELSRLVLVNENGKRRKIPMRAVIAKVAVNKAAQGHDKATATVLNEARLIEQQFLAEMPPANPGPEDQLVVAAVIRRIRSAGPDDAGAPLEPAPETSPANKRADVTK